MKFGGGLPWLTTTNSRGRQLDMEKIPILSRFPGILLIIGSVIGVIFWFIALFYAFFLGGSPGPYSVDRTVPLLYVPVIGLGFVGAIVGLVAGIKSTIRGANAPVSRLVVLAALLGAAGSVPFFLLDVWVEVGLVALAFGIAPAAVNRLLTLLLRQKRAGQSEKHTTAI